MDIESYFLDPSSKRQKQYEALRAFAVEKLPAEEVAEKYGYQTSTIYTMIRDVKSGKLELFPSVQKGPRQRRTSADHQKQILDLRKQNHSIHDIYDELLKLEINVSVKTIPGRGRGESIQMKFQGEGIVAIQPFEEIYFQSS